MPISTRAVAVLGLGLVGLVGLVAQSTLGQQTNTSDGQVQQANSNGQAQAPRAASAVPPAVIGAIDMERVINEYDRYKESSEQFQAEALKKQKELEVMLQEAKGLAEKMQQFKPGTPDYQKYSDMLTEAQAKFEAEKQQTASLFTAQESSAVAEIYNDIRYVVEWIAQRKGMTFVVQVGPNGKVTGENPNDVMAAVARNVVYHNPSTEITDEVIQSLNSLHERRKKAQGGAQNGQGGAAAAPSGN